jgi:hypothetical protein
MYIEKIDQETREEVWFVSPTVVNLLSYPLPAVGIIGRLYREEGRIGVLDAELSYLEPYSKAVMRLSAPLSKVEEMWGGKRELDVIVGVPVDEKGRPTMEPEKMAGVAITDARHKALGGVPTHLLLAVGIPIGAAAIGGAYYLAKRR